MKRKKILRVVLTILVVLVTVILGLALLGTVAHATGLVDDTISDSNLYSRYPLSNYQLDFFVDNSWGWLPWNWGDGIGKSVMYGLYCITNFIWTIVLYLSNATGYVVQEAYKLNIINDMADSIGKSMQTLAGVTKNGFSSTGFYVGFLLLLVLFVGIYVAYVGLIKRETSKALHAVINFVVVFLVSASFIAYAPDYIKKVNEFSSDISTSALDLGTKIIIPDSDSKGKDSVDLIRDSLFAIQVQQPWLLLQFGNSNIEEIGTERADALVSTSPSANDGEDREAIVKAEIEDKDNDNLTLPQVVNRLGMVFFLLIFDLGITIFVFLLTAMMIFSQILFIIFAMFLPISFLLSMIPTYEGMAKKAIVKVFNTIMMRAGITLIITIAFSISTMFYNLSDTYPFFMVAFLQIVTFAGIYFKLGDIMSMFNLDGNDSQRMGRSMFRRPYMLMRRGGRRMERRLARAVGTGATTGASRGAYTASAFAGAKQRNATETTEQTRQGKQNEQETTASKPDSFGKRVGFAVGKVADTKGRITDKAKAVKEQVQDMPTTARYAVHATKENVKENVADVKRGVVTTKDTMQQERAKKAENRRQGVAQKRMALQKAQEQRQNGSAKQATPEAPHSKERPVTKTEKPATMVEKPVPKTQEKERPVTTTPTQTERKERPVQKMKEPITDKAVKVARKSPAITKDTPINQRVKPTFKQQPPPKTGSKQKKGKKK